MNFKTFLILILSASTAFAAEGGHEHGHEGIPWMTIFYQALNVSMMFGGLFYFLKDGVKAHFQGKKQEFLSAFEKADSARKSAEAEKLQIEVKLSKLDSTLDETIQRARKEAAEMKLQIIQDAKEIAKRIRDEAAQSVQTEIVKAKNQLRDYLVRESIQGARKQLGTKVSTEDHQRLQSEFVAGLQVVQK